MRQHSAKPAQFFIIAANSGAFSQQSLLSDRRHQCSGPPKDQTSRKTSRAFCTGAILCVEQPFVRPEWSMKPQCVIKACCHEGLFEHRASVRHQGGIEQHQVRRVGQNALMDRCCIWQRAGGSYPNMESAVGKLLAEITLELDGTKLDRPFALEIAPDRIRH